jgi:hypothetical protein
MDETNNCLFLLGSPSSLRQAKLWKKEASSHPFALPLWPQNRIYPFFQKRIFFLTMMKRSQTVPLAVMPTTDIALHRMHQPEMPATFPSTTSIGVSVPVKDVTEDLILSKTAASSRLGDKLLGDVIVGSGVTFCVAPFLTVVDKAIVHSAAGNHTLMQSGIESIKGMVRNPIQYLKSPTFLFMWAAYAATYSTANSLKTIVEHKEYASAMRKEEGDRINKGPSSNSMALGKVGIFLGTTFVNSSASIVKDRAYARMFGSAVPTNIPRMTYALWMTRDLTVVGSSFILPDLFSGRIAEQYDMDPKYAHSIAQFAMPVAMQLIAGPLHYMGLDLYNRRLPDTMSWREAIVDRSKSLCRGFVPVVLARIARIAPGYGIGGVMNTHYRDSYRDHLIQREVKSMMKQDMGRDSASRLVALLHNSKK